MRTIAILSCLVLSACGHAQDVDPTKIAQPLATLMVEPREVKDLRKGGDLKRYTVIVRSRNSELVQQVKGLQAYASTGSGAKIIKPAKDPQKRPPSS